MPTKVQSNSNGADSRDTKLATEQIAIGEEKVPKVDFEADYAAAQQFSVSDIDRTEEGKIAAEAATAPQFKIPEPEETEITAQPTANPEDYIEMAQKIGAYRTDAITSVSDDLVKQALQKGEAAKK